jgi:hypothetical protein
VHFPHQTGRHPVSSAQPLVYCRLSRASPSCDGSATASIPGAASAMWSPAWRARTTTLSCGATTAGAGARSSSRAASSIRSRRMPARRGRGARGKRCSARPRMRCENLRVQMLRRMTGLRLMNHHDECANEGPIQRSPLSAAVIANAAAIGPRRRVSASCGSASATLPQAAPEHQQANPQQRYCRGFRNRR